MTSQDRHHLHSLIREYTDAFSRVASTLIFTPGRPGPESDEADLVVAKTNLDRFIDTLTVSEEVRPDHTSETWKEEYRRSHG